MEFLSPVCEDDLYQALEKKAAAWIFLECTIFGQDISKNVTYLVMTFLRMYHIWS